MSAHWNPLVQLSRITRERGADVIAAGARMLTTRPGGLPYQLALADLKAAHALIGAGIADYEHLIAMMGEADAVPLALGAEGSGT
jgi:hypothetical protein